MFILYMKCITCCSNSYHGSGVDLELSDRLSWTSPRWRCCTHLTAVVVWDYMHSRSYMLFRFIVRNDKSGRRLSGHFYGPYGQLPEFTAQLRPRRKGSLLLADLFKLFFFLSKRRNFLRQAPKQASTHPYESSRRAGSNSEEHFARRVICIAFCKNKHKNDSSNKLPQNVNEVTIWWAVLWETRFPLVYEWCLLLIFNGNRTCWRVSRKVWRCSAVLAVVPVTLFVSPILFKIEL